MKKDKDKLVDNEEYDIKTNGEIDEAKDNPVVDAILNIEQAEEEKDVY